MRSHDHGRAPRLAAALIALTLLALARGSARSQQPLPALHVAHRGRAAIVDDGGRQVLLRGVNTNQLGDYYQADPPVAQTVPLTESDFTQMAALGMNVVRLIVSWSFLQPQAGVIDQNYISQIKQAVGWAAAHGIYVVLDMHQDAWGKFIASPPNTQCIPPLMPAIGWDGAPQWATITDDMSTCRFQLRELSPAVAEAFENFWINRDGIQSELIDAWAALAGAFAADPTVAGYDFLNEPHPGWTPAATDVTLLGLYYRRVLRAIRAAEDSAPGGFHHVGFFEPMDTWSALSVGVSPEPFTLDRDIVFAPHLYAGSLTADRALGLDLISIEFGFDEAQREAERYGTTFWSGEWGWFGNPATDVSSVKEFARQEDSHLVGDAWWQWKQACGDPHDIGVPGGQPPTTSGNLVILSCPSNTVIGMATLFAHVLARAYPRYSPGRLKFLASDSDAGTMDLAGTVGGARSSTLEVWAPGTVAPVATGEGLRGVTIVQVSGGFKVSAEVAGDYSLRLAPP